MSDVNVIITSECEECRYGEVIEHCMTEVVKYKFAILIMYTRDVPQRSW